MKSTGKSRGELCRDSFAGARRGTVIVLVVAMLALLAVLGTAYIISARVDRGSARANSDAVNLDLARDAAMSIVRQRIFDSSLDNAGQFGGYGSGGTPKSSRFYDYPSIGSTFGQESYNTQYSDLPWLARGTLGPVANPTTDATRLSASQFNPSTGANDLTANALNVNVVGDQTNHGLPTGVTPSANDASLTLLSFSSPNVRYRMGYRIIDTNRMLNLNTGAPNAASGDTTGSYLSGMNLAAVGVMNTLFDARNPPPAPGPFSSSPSAEIAANLHNTLLGRHNGGAFALNSWNLQVLSLERALANTVSLFDLSDELELRSYGTYGTTYTTRPGATTSTSRVWPNTLGNATYSSKAVVGNVRRGSYTTYSWDRDLRRYADPSTPYTLTAGGGLPVGFTTSTVWPINPAKAWINPNLDITGNPPADAMFLHAMAATNLATAMEASGFTPQEARAFAANYMQYRWNSFQPDATISGVTAYWLPNGPTVIDDAGICFRAANSTQASCGRQFAGPNDLKSEVAGKVYLGYSPQPYINEVAAVVTYDGVSVMTVDNAAVELYNPYEVALSLNGYKLKTSGGTVTFSNQYIPARGFLVVITSATAPLDTAITTSGTSIKVADANLVIGTAAGAVQLTRTYYDRVGVAQDAPVDEFAYTPIVAAAGMPTGTTSYSVMRSNTTPDLTQTAVNDWLATVHNGAASTRTTTMKLGVSNPYVTGTSAFYLYDMFGVTATPNLGLQGQKFANIAAFNRVMRIGNSFVGGSSNVISAQLDAVCNGTPPAPYSGMDFPKEAMIRFDFKAAPWFYNQDPSTFAGAISIKPGDPKAVRLLDYVAMTDRVYDTSIDTGYGPVSINKLRLPGRINVNTASPLSVSAAGAHLFQNDVLRAIPNMTDEAVANIIGYRERRSIETAATKTVTYNGATSGNFTNSANFPGSGIRSVAEVLFCLPVAGSPANLDTRDALWASMANYLTVRSDTFVVYGYLEAVRASSVASHNNAIDWYTGATTDDVKNTSALNIRLAKRRWVAIIDRSFSNYQRSDPNFVLPRVVAFKDMPQ